MYIEEFVIGACIFLGVIGVLIAIDNFTDYKPPSGPFDGFQ